MQFDTIAVVNEDVFLLSNSIMRVIVKEAKEVQDR